MNDVMPNDGGQREPDMPALGKPEPDTTKASKKSIQENMIEWFDNSIKEFTSIAGIQIGTDMSVESQVAAYQLMAMRFDDKKAEFIKYLEDVNE